MLAFLDSLRRKTTVSFTTPLPTLATGSAASGGAIGDAGSPQLVAGSDGGSVRTLATGTTGALLIGNSGNTATAVVGGQVDSNSNSSNGLTTRSFSYVFNGASWDRMRGEASTGLFVVTKGGASIATAQVPVTATAAQVVAARAGRKNVTLTSTSAFWVGPTGVTSTTGFPVAAGAAITLNTAAAVFAVAAAAGTVAVIEDY